MNVFSPVVSKSSSKIGFGSGSRRQRRFGLVINSLFCLLLSCLLIVQQSAASIMPHTRASASFEANQMAEILGVKPQLDRLVAMQGAGTADSTRETVALKGLILQKILAGYVEVRRACDTNDRELSYSYNVMRREQRKQDLINQCFTLVNFAQLGTLYTMEPFLRLNHQFEPSGLCTQSGSGAGLTLPIISMIQQRTAHVGDVAPPAVLQGYIEGGPVDSTGLPPYVEGFLAAEAPGSIKSRREEMFELWKKRYGVDASRKENLCSLRDRSPKKLRMLNTRILLLWSLHTFILEMDHSLLSLLHQVEGISTIQPDQSVDDSQLIALGVSPAAIDAARLLKVESAAAQLVRLNKNGGGDEDTRQKLEFIVLAKVLEGALEVRDAADQIDTEINYANDVVLAELLMKRGKALQRNYEANFIQAGTFGSIAGYMYLKHYTKVGNEMFVISGGIGTALSILAIHLMHGGSRAIDTSPNSLADVFNLSTATDYRFSPLMATFLNSPAPDSKDKRSRREVLVQYWQEHKTSTVKLKNSKNLHSLAAMPPANADTIKVVTNRIAMLHGLLTHIELLDSELLDLLHVTAGPGASEIANGSQPSTVAGEGPLAAQTAALIGAQPQINYLAANAKGTEGDANSSAQRLLLIRKVFTTVLDVRNTADTLDYEISYEYDVLGRMTRSRDHTVAVTNNINFFQLNILATIIDGPLGLSGNPRHVRASNMLNIVSGFAVGGLALLSLLEQHGGLRPMPAYPNMVGQCVGLSPPNEERFSPVIWKFINEVPAGSPTGKTRVETMIESWKATKSVTMNMDRQSNREKVAAYGPAHTKLSETIKLIKNRLNMMYDVRGIVGLFDEDLDDLLRTVG